MSSSVEELMPLVLGKGCSMRLFIDHSKPKDDPEYNWVETTYDGKEDSEVIVVPAHWHWYHDETMEVLEGRMIFYVDGKEIVGSAGDPPIVIAAGVVHGFSAIKGEQVTFKESTRPSGTFKAHFFQDLFRSSASPGFFMAMRAFYDGDTYVSLPGKLWVLDYVFISVVGLISKAFAPTKLPEIKRMGEQGATAEQIAASKGFFSK